MPCSFGRNLFIWLLPTQNFKQSPSVLRLLFNWSSSCLHVVFWSHLVRAKNTRSCFFIMPFFQGIILTICNLTFMVLHFGNFMRSDSETNYRIFFSFKQPTNFL